MTIPNVKTGRTTGESFRMIPPFPEVRCHLEEFDNTTEDTEHVITRYRDANTNFRTQLTRIARRGWYDNVGQAVRELASELRDGTAANLPGLRGDGVVGARKPWQKPAAGR